MEMQLPNKNRRTTYYRKIANNHRRKKGSRNNSKEKHQKLNFCSNKFKKTHTKENTTKGEKNQTLNQNRYTGYSAHRIHGQRSAGQRVTSRKRAYQTNKHSNRMSRIQNRRLSNYKIHGVSTKQSRRKQATKVKMNKTKRTFNNDTS